MIPQIYLSEWRQVAPWSDDGMVEQDLIISRLLVELFNDPDISDSFAFREGRDLFDLWFALQQPNFNASRAVTAFIEYTKSEGKNITRAMFDMNFAQKKSSGSFALDISPLLAPTVAWDFNQAAEEVYDSFISLLPGARWKANK